MTHRELASVVAFLVSPEVLKSDKRAFAREIKILRDRICRGGKYDSKDFFLSLSYPAYFQSLAIFIKGEMAQDLEWKWRYYQMSLAQQSAANSSRLQNSPTNSLDNEDNSHRVEGMSGKSEEVTAKIARKQSVVDWADSPTPIP